MRNVRLAVVALALPLFFFSMVSMPCLAQGGGATAGTGWQSMSIPGATVHFEMPKPIRMNESKKEGMVVYVSKKGKMSFKVGIVRRNYKQDQAKGLSDDKVLNNFALRILAASKMQFKQMGYESKFKYVAPLTTPTGNGKQFQGKVGKAFVMNRFYINKQGIYWVEAITQNVQDPDINRFLNSFRP